MVAAQYQAIIWTNVDSRLLASIFCFDVKNLICDNQASEFFNPGLEGFRWYMYLVFTVVFTGKYHPGKNRFWKEKSQTCFEQIQRSY